MKNGYILPGAGDFNILIRWCFPLLVYKRVLLHAHTINIKGQAFLNTYPYSLLVTSWVNRTQELKPCNQGRPQVTRRKLLDLQK